MEQEQERPFFLREDGTKVFIKSISMLELQKVEEGVMREFRERGEPIDPPTYEVETAGGGKLKLPMDASNLEVEGDPAESQRRQDLWRAHRLANERMRTEIGEISTEIIMEGIVCDMPSDEWIAKKRKRHIQIPDDPEELLALYKTIEIIRTPGDLVKAQQEIMILSGSGAISREDIEAAGATFLSKIQAIGKRPTGEVAKTGGNGSKATEEQLDIN